MVTESEIQAGIREFLLELPEFGSSDVVLNDWSLLDGSTQGSPYVIIETADEVDSVQDTYEPQNTYHVPFILFVRFEGWRETYAQVQSLRQAILTQINSGAARAAGGLEGVNVRRFRTDSPIIEWYEEGSGDDALPLYIFQRYILEVETF